MEKVSVLAITKNGINIGIKLKELFPNWEIFAPVKLSNENNTLYGILSLHQIKLLNFLKIPMH